MFVRWLGPAGPSGALHAVSEAVRDGAHDARGTLARGGTAGLEVMRSFGSDVADGVRQMRGSGRAAVADHPVAALLAAGVVGFAAGWVLRRARELRSSGAARARARAERGASRAPASRPPRKQAANGSRRPSARQIM
jgi:hypothetical protein